MSTSPVSAVATRPTLALAGASNGSGKTTLACRIIEAYPGRWQAVKVSTVYYDGNCPVPEDGTPDECACRSLRGGPWVVVEDRERLAEADTDTGKLITAGADPVGWGLSRPNAHALVWKVLEDRTLDPAKPLITEGNQIAAVLGAELDDLGLIVVLNPIMRRRWKDDAWELAAHADFVVVNPNAFDRFEADHREVGPVLERLQAENVAHAVFDCARPAAEWPAALRDVVERVLAAG